MVYLDANVLIRFILKDNKEMAAKASDAITTGEAFVLEGVFAEVVYVLTKVYNTDRAVVTDYLLHLLPFVKTDNAVVLKSALHYYAETKLDFVECLLAAYHLVEKKEILTFDRKLNNFIKRAKKEMQEA